MLFFNFLNNNKKKYTKNIEKQGEIVCNCEFGYELQLVIPYAYYLYKHNKLKSTTSSLMTKELYYFSKNHHEKFTKRQFGVSKIIPNQTPHVKELNYNQYLPPPYKEIYRNNFFVYDKPLLIIHNKYNIEWGSPPINYINKDTLQKIFEMYGKKYTIVYIRPQKKHIVEDHNMTTNLNENYLLNIYNIIDGNTLYTKTKNRFNIHNFNHFQLLLHANCDHFISVQGGNCVLASYFGGTNIIFAKKGSELSCSSYQGHYKKYSNCNVLQTNNYKDLLMLIKMNF